MGSSHGGTRSNGVGGVAVVVRGVGGDTRGVDIDSRTRVGEVSNLVQDVGSTDRNDVADRATERAGSVVAGIGTVVSGRDGNVDAGVRQSNESVLNGSGAAVETKGERGDGANETTFAGARIVRGGDVVETADQARGSSRTGRVQDLDSN